MPFWLKPEAIPSFHNDFISVYLFLSHSAEIVKFKFVSFNVSDHPKEVNSDT